MMQLYRRILEEEGFTLMELVVVLAILAMLAALAIPQFTKVMDNSRVKADNSNIALVETAIEVYRADVGNLPSVTGESNIEKFESLVKKLNDEQYLKNKEIKAQQANKAFGYDDSTGTVTLDEITQ